MLSSSEGLFERTSSSGRYDTLARGCPHKWEPLSSQNVGTRLGGWKPHRVWEIGVIVQNWAYYNRSRLVLEGTISSRVILSLWQRSSERVRGEECSAISEAYLYWLHLFGLAPHILLLSRSLTACSESTAIHADGSKLNVPKYSEKMTRTCCRMHTLVCW
jgi:hypothetical protein